MSPEPGDSHEYEAHYKAWDDMQEEMTQLKEKCDNLKATVERCREEAESWLKPGHGSQADYFAHEMFDAIEGRE